MLAPQRTAASSHVLNWSVQAGKVPLPPLQSAAALALAGNAMADALPLLEALARDESTPVALPLGPTGILRLHATPLA